MKYDETRQIANKYVDLLRPFAKRILENGMKIKMGKSYDPIEKARAEGYQRGLDKAIEIVSYELSYVCKMTEVDLPAPPLYFTCNYIIEKINRARTE